MRLHLLRGGEVSGDAFRNRAFRQRRGERNGGSAEDPGKTGIRVDRVACRRVTVNARGIEDRAVVFTAQQRQTAAVVTVPVPDALSEGN